MKAKLTFTSFPTTSFDRYGLLILKCIEYKTMLNKINKIEI